MEGILLGKIKTSGGRYNPENKGIYFPATDLNRLLRNIHVHERALVPLNILKGEQSQDKLSEIAKHGVNLFIDSGCFFLASEMAKRNNISIDDAFALPPSEVIGYASYMEVYFKFLSKYESDIWGIVEMDFGGADGKKAFRKEAHKRGFYPIPVYHLLVDPAEYLEELLSTHDRICIGNLAQMGSGDVKRVLPALWDACSKYPDVWVHLLGVTPRPRLVAYPFHSYDSSSWLAAVKWTNGYTVSYHYSKFGTPGKEFWFVRGVNTDSPSGSAKAAGLAVYEALLRDRNHNQHLREIL